MKHTVNIKVPKKKHIYSIKKTLCLKGLFLIYTYIFYYSIIPPQLTRAPAAPEG